MIYLRTICSYILLSPFLVIGVFMHFCMIGMEMTRTMMMRFMLPKEIYDAMTKQEQPDVPVIAATAEEFKTFTEKYHAENPSATPEEAIKAFVKSKMVQK